MPSGTSALTAVNPIADSSAKAASSTGCVRPTFAQYWIGFTARRFMSGTLAQAHRTSCPSGLVDPGDDRDGLSVGLQIHPELFVTVQGGQEVLVLPTMGDRTEPARIGPSTQGRPRRLREVL